MPSLTWPTTIQSPDYQFNTVNKPLTEQLNDSTAAQTFPVVQGSVFHFKALVVVGVWIHFSILINL